MAMSDEASHLFAAYQLSRACRAGYAWTGMDADRARRFAAFEAWLWMFAVEYPIDAYNPGQGFGVSDLLFNTVGVMAAYHHARPGDQPIWDVKISVKRSFLAGQSRLIAYTNKQYDDYVYWLTIRPLRRVWMPLFGVGYSTAHDKRPGVIKEMHVGVGFSAAEVGELLGSTAARYLRPFSFFFFNLNTKITWR